MLDRNQTGSLGCAEKCVSQLCFSRLVSAAADDIGERMRLYSEVLPRVIELVDIPVFAFVSGFLSRGDQTPTRVRRRTVRSPPTRYFFLVRNVHEAWMCSHLWLLPYLQQGAQVQSALMCAPTPKRMHQVHVT